MFESPCLGLRLCGPQITSGKTATSRLTIIERAVPLTLNRDRFYARVGDKTLRFGTRPSR
jgi:hypothetical protein